MAIKSILDSVKKVLGIEAEYKAFDEDVLMHINTAFATLYELGVGPKEGFEIEDNVSVWEDYLGDDPNLDGVKTYVFLRVKLLFDPPTTSFAIEALNKQRQELEWRLNVYKEGGAT